jgi:hypothetical protein
MIDIGRISGYWSNFRYHLTVSQVARNLAGALGNIQSLDRDQVSS